MHSACLCLSPVGSRLAKLMSLVLTPGSRISALYSLGMRVDVDGRAASSIAAASSASSRALCKQRICKGQGALSTGFVKQPTFAFLRSSSLRNFSASFS